jgi:hypothetical protein
MEEGCHTISYFGAVKHEKRRLRPAGSQPSITLKGHKCQPGRTKTENLKKRSDTKDARSKFKGAITAMLHRQMKSVMMVVQQQAPSLCKVSSDLEIIR